MARLLTELSRGALYAILIGAPLVTGAHRGWPLAAAHLLVIVALLTWFGGMLAAGRLEWRRTALDLPLALLLALVLAQLTFGNGPLVEWALAPPPPRPELAAGFPAPWLRIGTVAPWHTLNALLLFAGYTAVYYLVVNHLRTRRQVGRLVRTLVVVGGLAAFLGLVDYLSRESWIFELRDFSPGMRLVGPFFNPDHFATWLAMLIALGIGWLMTRARGERTPSLASILSVPELRERAVRRYLPLVAVVTMAIALVFTLSRGGVLSLVAGLLLLLALLSARGRTRRSLALTGALLLAVLGYGSWIGFGPLLERFGVVGESTVDRWTQYLASWPMLGEFPLGVGLGAYREIYFRYQPIAHRPHEVYYPFGHNDVLQLVLETGVLGALLAAFALWRLVADLGAAHLFGRGACPVDGGAGEEAERHDPYSLGIAIGALAGVAMALVHSTHDYPLRVPANGFLAAALLGLATVTLHTRLHRGQEQLLTAAWTLVLRGRRWVGAGALALVALAASLAWGLRAVQVAVPDAAFDIMSRVASPADATAVLAVDPRQAAAREARAVARRDAAFAAWASRKPVADLEARSRAVTAMLASAREDLRVALGTAPTNPFLHHHLAWLEGIEVAVRDRRGPDVLGPALAHAARAVALSPENPRLYASTARLAATLPELGVRAAREAVRREPGLLPGLVDAYLRRGLTESEWLAFVPESAVDRLDLATVLEARRLRAESLAAYAAAVDLAPARERPIYLWALALALGRQGRAETAERLAEALRLDPGNPELHRAAGEALARRGDPAALDQFRLALAAAERRPRAGARPEGAFTSGTRRLTALVARHAGEDLSQPTRYRRSLARYLLDRKLWEQAAQEWEQVALEDPRRAEAPFALGVAAEARGGKADALSHYRKAVELDPASAAYRERLAQRLWESEQYFQAINEWRVVKGQTPRNLDARLALGRAYERIGERRDAIREYREILEVQPGHPGALQGLSRLGWRP